MVKILSQSGTSLADVYNVKGSIGAIDQLLTEDVSLIHEMGGQIFSERLRTFIITIPTTAIAQDITFDIAGPIALPDSPNRVIGVSVFVDNTARLDNAALIVRETTTTVTDAEFPIWNWDSTNGVEAAVRVALEGGAPGANIQLIPVTQVNPFLLTRNADNTMPVFRFRGLTSGFGAGTVLITAQVMVCRANPQVSTTASPSSHGLPLPSW